MINFLNSRLLLCEWNIGRGTGVDAPVLFCVCMCMCMCVCMRMIHKGLGYSSDSGHKRKKGQFHEPIASDRFTRPSSNFALCATELSL